MLFSAKTLDFLFENRLNNSRDWFWEHRKVYDQYVFAPLHDLVQELAPCMLRIDALLTTEPKVDKTICRIRRDTRFSHDKSLYRENLWIIFKRGRMHSTEAPGLYFEISPEGFNYGCGFYHASTSYMNTLRSMVLKGDHSFEEARAAFEGQSVYHMEGDCYKRPRFPDQPEEIRNWLERRNIGFTAESKDFALLFSDGLAAKLKKDFEALAPIYHFLLQASIADRLDAAERADRSAGVR